MDLVAGCGDVDGDGVAPGDKMLFEGNFEQYAENLRRRKGPDALEPASIKYRKLVQQ